MAVVFPQGIEVFGNCPSCVIGVNGYQSGAATGDAPAAGTTESWTMSTGYSSFPVAQTSTVPNNYFYIRDPADTTNEIVLVSTGGSSSTTWSVQRGMNGTTATHAAGATWVQVISPYTLQNFKQAVGAATSPVTVNSTTETVLATYTPTSAELVAGATFEAVAYGTYTTPTGTSAIRGIQFCLRWGWVSSGSPGTLLAYIATGTIASAPTLTANSPPTLTTVAGGSSFDVNGDITLISLTTVTANLNAWFGTALTSTALNATTVNTATSGLASSTAITISGGGPLVLTCKLGSASSTVVATAPLIYREA